jgi:DNA-binding MarR family transcriptional regulator
VRKLCERPDDEKFRAWPLFLEAHALLLDLLEQELRASGGPPLSWYDVLVQLAMSPEGRLTMKQLSASVLLSKSGVTRLVDRMEREGLVERDACPSDRRIVYAKLTPKGRATFKKVAPGHVDSVRRHFVDRLSDGEARMLTQALAKLLAAAAAQSSIGGSEHSRRVGPRI